VTDARPKIIGGGLSFRSDASVVDVISLVERLLGVELAHERQDGDSESYSAGALGVRVSLKVTRGGASNEYSLAYRSANPYYVAPADVVSLDFHFERMLSTEGIESRPLRTA
jgi:hypothetical protein